MYGLIGIFFVSILLLGMFLFMELGFKMGKARSETTASSFKSHVKAIQASMLSILALLLGFTFSFALQNHDARIQAVTAEANALGTAYLRTELLPKNLQKAVQASLLQHLEARIAQSESSPTDIVTLEQLKQKRALIESQLWSYATQAAEIDKNTVATGYFIKSLNESLDAATTTKTRIYRKVPEIIYILLFISLVLVAAILGYSTGLDGRRITFASSSLVVLTALVVLVIVDLDAPGRGTIRVNYDNLTQLQQSIQSKHIDGK